MRDRSRRGPRLRRAGDGRRGRPRTGSLVRTDRSARTSPSSATTIAERFAERFEELAGYCAAVRAVLPDDGILVDEMTQVGYFARNGFPCYSPRTYIGSGYQGTLGFGYATALGAKVGRPDRGVVSVSGDGGFLYNVAELATAVRHGIGVPVVVFDDAAFGNVKRIQSRTFGREIASSLTNPDFVALAQFLRRAGLSGRRPRRARRRPRRCPRPRRASRHPRALGAAAGDLGHLDRQGGPRLLRPRAEPVVTPAAQAGSGELRSPTMRSTCTSRAA